MLTLRSSDEVSFFPSLDESVIKNTLKAISFRRNKILFCDCNYLIALNFMNCSESVFKNVFSKKINSEKLRNTSHIILKTHSDNKKILNMVQSLGFFVILDYKNYLFLNLPLEKDFTREESTLTPALSSEIESSLAEIDRTRE